LCCSRTATPAAARARRSARAPVNDTPATPCTQHGRKAHRSALPHALSQCRLPQHPRPNNRSAAAAPALADGSGPTELADRPETRTNGTQTACRLGPAGRSRGGRSPTLGSGRSTHVRSQSAGTRRT
jgi:hypothetical protein